MIHQLALLTSKETPSLLKEAVGVRDDAAIRLEEKLLEKAKAKGIEVPMKEKYTGWSFMHNKPIGSGEMVPDYDKLRLNIRADATAGKAEVVTPKTRAAKIDPATGHAVMEEIADGGKTVTKAHRIPGASVPGPSPLAEREIQKAYGDVSNSMAKRMRHKYIGGAKRLWGGQGFLGGKWRNRAGILGGLGTLGLGIKTYLDSTNDPDYATVPQQPTPEQTQAAYNQYAQPQMQQQYAPQPQYYTPQYAPQPQYYKMGSSKYSPDAVTIPKPTPQPSVKALGPGVSSAPKLTGGRKGFGTGSSGGLLGGSSGTSGSTSGSSEKRADETGVLPLLGAAAGGAGGWALGQKFLVPTLQKKEETLAKEIAQKQKQLKMLQGTSGKAAIGTAAAGAILLAALSALYAKKKTEEKHGVRPIAPPYDNTHAGFQPQHQVYNPYGGFYG